MRSLLEPQPRFGGAFPWPPSTRIGRFDSLRPSHLHTLGDALRIHPALLGVAPPTEARRLPDDGSAGPCRASANHAQGERLDDPLPAGRCGRESPQCAVLPDRRRVVSTIFRTFDQATASVCTTCG